MVDCYPIIKYLFLALLYLYAFICIYIPPLETIGFYSLFSIQLAFSVALVFDMINDKLRIFKVLLLDGPVAATQVFNSIGVKLWWILIAGLALQLTSITLMLITVVFLEKKFNNLRLSRDNRRRFDYFKIFFIIATVFLFIISYAYVQYGAGLSNTFKMVIAFSMVGLFGLASAGVYMSNMVSKLIGATTDG
jgi:hypothetical protein